MQKQIIIFYLFNKKLNNQKENIKIITQTRQNKTILNFIILSLLKLSLLYFGEKLNIHISQNKIVIYYSVLSLRKILYFFSIHLILIQQLTKKQLEIDKKEKEVQNLLLDIQNNTLRKKNCAFCGEFIEFKGNKDEYLNEINEKLNEKNERIKKLEGKIEQSNCIISIASNSLFNLMSNKVNDKEMKLMAIKEQYEAKLMEAEEYLASEHEQSALLVKQRIAEATEKVEKSLQPELSALKNKLNKMEKKVLYYEKENKKISSMLQSSLGIEKSLKQEQERIKRDMGMKKEALIQKDSILKQTIEAKKAIQKELNEVKFAHNSNLKVLETKYKIIDDLKEECEALKKDIVSTKVSLKEKDKKQLI